MLKVIRVLALATFLAALAAGSSLAQAPGESPRSTLRAGSDYPGIVPGDSVVVALELSLEKGWHTYWVNGGDAGFPLAVDWELPKGYSAGAIQWPPPSLLPTPPLMSYGYKENLTALATIRAPRGAKVGDAVALRASVSWLVCSDVCLPAQDSITIALKIETERTRPNVEWQAKVAAASRDLPHAPPNNWSRAWATDSGYVVELRTSNETPLVAPYLFVDSAETVDHARPQLVRRYDDRVVLALQRSEFATGAAARLRGILVSDASAPRSMSWTIDVAVQSAAPDSATLPQWSGAPSTQATGGFAGVASPGGSTAAPGMTLLGALALAFLGGIILNLMPCVFPVLSLKVLSFVRHNDSSPRATRMHGLAFTGGVVVSFWILAAALFALRAGGESLGWGFQLQSPLVVAALALGLFALGLNMSGLFEMGLSLTRLGAVGRGDRLSDSALTGILAVVVAAPCTAPFMGAALGFAVVQPPMLGIAVFTALALGLAAPYLVLSNSPRLLRHLPKPGAWMLTLKQLLAFPIYATVVWLVWVYGRQAGVSAAAALLIALVVLALGAWLYGRGQATAAGAAVRVLAAASLIAACAIPVFATTRLSEGPTADVGGDGWEVYSPDRLLALRAEGRPVFVDFTAAWCLSCQVNERIALGKPETRAAFAQANVALLRADWTSRDAEIAKAIQALGRSGIPLYAFYSSDPSRPPEILPALLTPSIVIGAVKRAAAQ